MKLAPNVKRLPKDKYTDAIILRVLMLIHSQSITSLHRQKSRRSSPSRLSGALSVKRTG